MDTTVRVTSRTLGTLYVIDITNQGRGMSEEQIQTVKQPLTTFVQFDRSYFEQQGTGLGLTLTRSIIALYDGFFDIVSDSIQTTVSIGFPYHKS
jgi:signal transduction histidine kinase